MKTAIVLIMCSFLCACGSVGTHNPDGGDDSVCAALCAACEDWTAMCGGPDGKYTYDVERCKETQKENEKTEDQCAYTEAYISEMVSTVDPSECYLHEFPQICIYNY